MTTITSYRYPLVHVPVHGVIMYGTYMCSSLHSSNEVSLHTGLHYTCA